jgi:arginase
MKTCSIIDAPSDLGLRPTGVDGLPHALRSAGLLEGLPAVRRAGSIPAASYSPARSPLHGVLNVDGIAGFSRRLAERVAFTLDLGLFPVVLGGDCSILIGTTLALRRRGRFGLLFFDGHADFYSPETEPYGEVASMDLAVVTGRGPAELSDIEQLSPLVQDDHAVVFGIRDATLAASEGSPDVKQTAMRVFELADVRNLGAAHAARQSVETLEKSGVEGFWIHLDADVLHDDVMPAVDYRLPDGLWPHELSEALAVALASPLAVGMDMTIYNPALDSADLSAARTLARAVTTAFAAAS